MKIKTMSIFPMAGIQGVIAGALGRITCQKYSGELYEISIQLPAEHFG
jgi:hypothetical protein